jgi:hypothetical protein
MKKVPKKIKIMSWKRTREIGRHRKTGGRG